MKKISDGLVLEQGSVYLVDQPTTLDRMGQYVFRKCFVDGVYFDLIKFELGFQDEMEVQGVDEGSSIEVYRIRPIAREQKPAELLPDPTVSDGNMIGDGNLQFHEMFKQFASIYGLGKPDEMDKKLEKHLQKLAAEAEEETSVQADSEIE